MLMKKYAPNLELESLEDVLDKAISAYRENDFNKEETPSASTGGYVPTGWICPKCGNVYSPTTSMCYRCSKLPQITCTY